METNVQTITLAGERFVILPEAEYRQLRGDKPEPALPAADTQGNYPAVEALRFVLARKIVRRRRAAGLSQVELAKRAGIRAETLNRLEQGKHTPTVETIDKIDRVLGKLEKQ
jgi:ribosome-binding protein aMBF1 (putative translation factor)